jgi:hypothetical protein
VTRLGKFLPIRQLFTLDIFLNYRSILGYFFQENKSRINFDKKGLHSVLGDFFTNSSGHLFNVENLMLAFLLKSNFSNFYGK